MDFIQGMRLFDVWNDTSWWTGLRSRESVLQQLALYLVELSQFQFHKIGFLDHVDPPDPSRGVHVVPFHEYPQWEEIEFIEPLEGLAACTVERAGLEFGPFTSCYQWLRALLEECRSIDKRKSLCALQLLLGVVPELAYDGPPFVIVHGTLNTPNILVDDNGTVTDIVDWDGSFIGPRQFDALGYPAWSTVDWDPCFYGWSRPATPEQNAYYDSPEELGRLRKVYADAIDSAPGGTLGGPV